MMASGLITPIKAPNLNFYSSKRKGKNKKSFEEKIHSPTSFYFQLYVLLKRTFLILSRDPTLTYSRLGVHFLIAIFIGILYFGIGEDASNVLNNFNYLFFSAMFLMYTAFSCVTITCKFFFFFEDGNLLTITVFQFLQNCQ